MSITKKKIIAFIVLIGVVILWGLAPVVSKSIFNDENPSYSPGVLVALRGFFSIIALAIFINKGFKKMNKSYWICIPAGLILTAAYLFQIVGLKHTVPSNNTFLENISCAVIPLFMFLFVRERPTIHNTVAAILCVVGSIFLIGNGFDFAHFFNEEHLLGNVLSAIGGLFFGLDIAFTKAYCQDKDPLLYVFLQLVVLTIASFFYAHFIEEFVFQDFAISFDWFNLLLVAFLGVVCTAICWVARAGAIHYVNAMTVSVLNPISAITATVFSIFLNMEQLTINLIVGGIIILISITLASVFNYYQDVHKKKNNKESEQTEQTD